ncbi:hypothetical protein Hanom_Chr02g00147871 [Helianthus anomalus]
MLVHKLIVGMFILMNCLNKDFVCLITIVVHVDRLFDQSCCFAEVKTNNLLLADCRGLVQLFCCRCLQMWSADWRRFTLEKTNSTLVFAT